MPIYMKYGEVIKGDVTAAGHAGEIDLTSCQMGTAYSSRSTKTNEEGSVPAVSEILITKTRDGASSALFQEALNGNPTKVKVNFLRTDDKGVTPYLSLELEDAMISNYNVSGSGANGTALESFTIDFSKIQFAKLKAPGTTAEAKEKLGWDVALDQSGG